MNSEFSKALRAVRRFLAQKSTSGAENRLFNEFLDFFENEAPKVLISKLSIHVQLRFKPNLSIHAQFRFIPATIFIGKKIHNKHFCGAAPN